MNFVVAMFSSTDITTTWLKCLGVLIVFQMIISKLNNRRVELASRSVDIKLNQIHTFVNSEYGEALKLAAEALERVAILTNNPKDIEKAEEARATSNEHEKKIPYTI